MPRPPDIADVRSIKSNERPPREILIECMQIGNAVRVMAIDVATTTEINFQAPAHASRAMIERIARDKMNYVMKKGKI